MVSIYGDMNCCAISGITGLNDGRYKGPKMEQALRDVLTQPNPYNWGRAHLGAGCNPGDTTFRRPATAFYYFVQGSDGEDYGKRFKEVIEKYDLGTVTESTPGYNPHHGDKKVTVYIWALAPDKMETWWEANCQASPTENQERIKQQKAAEQKATEQMAIMQDFMQRGMAQ